MPLIKVESIGDNGQEDGWEIYINPDDIRAIYYNKDHDDWVIDMGYKSEYLTTEKFARRLIEIVGVMEI